MLQRKLAVVVVLLFFTAAYEAYAKGRLGSPMARELIASIRSGNLLTLGVQMSDILAHGEFDVNSVINEDGDTLMHIAAEEGQADIAVYLAERGGKVDVENKRGITPIEKATLYSNEGMVSLLRRIPSTVKPIKSVPHDTRVAGIEDSPTMRVAVRMAGREAARHPLVDAVYEDDYDEVLRLLDSGIDPNAREDWDGNTALMAAKDPKIAKALIEAGANPNLRNGSWDHVLIENAKNVRNENLSLLAIYIEAGADLNAQELDNVNFEGKRSYNSGFTALHHATLLGKIETVKALDAAGAKLTIKDGHGRTPADVADEFVAKRGKDMWWNFKQFDPTAEDIEKRKEIAAYLRTRMDNSSEGKQVN